MKTRLAAALGLIAGQSSAQPLFDQIREMAPKSLFDVTKSRTEAIAGVLRHRGLPELGARTPFGLGAHLLDLRGKCTSWSFFCGLIHRLHDF